MQDSTHLYGIDWDAPLPTEHETDESDIERVRVSAPLNPLTEEQYSELQMRLPAMTDYSADDYRFSLYMDCVHFVQLRME